MSDYHAFEPSKSSAKRAAKRLFCQTVIAPLKKKIKNTPLDPDYLSKIRAIETVQKQCCPEMCLLKFNSSSADLKNSVAVVEACRAEIQNLGHDERYNYLARRFKASIKTKVFNPQTPNVNCLQFGKRINHEFKLGLKGHELQVCRFAFCNAYGVSHFLLDKIASNYKKGLVEYTRSIGDTSRPNLSMKELNKACAEHNLKMCLASKQAALIPRTTAAIRCFLWMGVFFAEFGDQSPNSDGEIHLDPVEKKDIWEEYVRDIVSAHPDDPQFYEYPAFCEMWSNLFPHVLIREYKNVTGKCICCFHFTKMRWECKDPKKKQLLRELHAFHRSTFMNERIHYYRRIEEALENPGTVMSVIMDGMAQNHCILPWNANQHEFSDPLVQHLQGVLEHGNRLTIYRTFHTVSKSANLSVYVLLSQLEKFKLEYDKYPEKLYLQFDGGSENANKWIIAIAEYLVGKRLVDEIYLSRLLVGHTHEDIDSKFGILWVALRNIAVDTPQAYKEKILEAFGGSDEARIKRARRFEGKKLKVIFAFLF